MFIPPMLLGTSAAPFTDPDYIFEPKIDGHRLEFIQENGQIRLYTRHNNDCTNQYPEMHTAFTDDVILDGEVACVDQTGSIDFESVMARFQAKKADKIRRLSQQLPATYVIRYIEIQRQGLTLTTAHCAQTDTGQPRSAQ